MLFPIQPTAGRCLCACAAVLLLFPAVLRAEGKRGWLDPLTYRDAAAAPVAKLSKLEIVEMLSAVLGGSELMGPSDGWFHPSVSRYSWKWLAQKYDANGDGKITPAEFKGPPELFARLDRDRDGALTRDDFDWSMLSPYLQQMGMVRRWMQCIDTNSNGRMSKQEWVEFFEKAAKGKDHLTPEDLRDALMQMPRREGPPPKQEPIMPTLLRGLFKGELGSFFEGPQLGERAPNFTLKTHNGKRTISLADYRGKKPVVLIFGSFT
jgi:hypothetical protein